MTSTDALDDPWAALAGHVRSLADATVDRAIDDDAARRASVGLACVDEALRELARRRRDLSRILELSNATEGQAIQHTDHCCVCGPRNGGGLGLTAEWRGESVVAKVTLTASHEGAPGIAHGGIVALLFDDVLSYPPSVKAGFVVTADLNIKYLAPTPTHVPLELSARCVSEVAGRSLVTGVLTADGEITAIATGWFRASDRSLVEVGAE